MDRWLDHDLAVQWMEIISLRGRQICMTGGSEDVYLAGVRLT